MCLPGCARHHRMLAMGLSSFVKLANDGLAQSDQPLLAAPGRRLRFTGLAAGLSPCLAAQTRYPRRNALDWLHLADAGGGSVALPRAGLSPCLAAQTRYPRRNALDWLHLADAGGG